MHSSNTALVSLLLLGLGPKQGAGICHKHLLNCIRSLPTCVPVACSLSPQCGLQQHHQHKQQYSTKPRQQCRQCTTSTSPHQHQQQQHLCQQWGHSQAVFCQPRARHPSSAPAPRPVPCAAASSGCGELDTLLPSLECSCVPAVHAGHDCGAGIQGVSGKQRQLRLHACSAVWVCESMCGHYRAAAARVYVAPWLAGR
jgi:hypothetical protein